MRGDADMKGTRWKIFLALALLTEGLGALVGWLTRDASALYEATVNKPPLSPPGWIFPVVWTALYALMALSAARVWAAPESRERSLGLGLFFAQLGLNLLWPFLFFSLGWYAVALLWLVALWAMVLWMVATFEKTDPAAAWLQTPYLLWLTFATYLNFGVWLLNR